MTRVSGRLSSPRLPKPVSVRMSTTLPTTVRVLAAISRGEATRVTDSTNRALTLLDISSSFCYRRTNERNRPSNRFASSLRADLPPYLPRLPDLVDHRIDEELHQERSEYPPDHGGGDPAHHVRTGAVGPHDRHQAHEHDRDRHDLRPEPLHRAFHDRVLEVRHALHATLTAGPFVGAGEVEQHEHARLRAHPAESGEAHPHRDCQG